MNGICARLLFSGLDTEALGLSMTDMNRGPKPALFNVNKIDTTISVELRSAYGYYKRAARLEILDDLLGLVDSLTAFSKLDQRAVSWSTSNGILRIILNWNSSLDISCRVIIGTRLQPDETDDRLRSEDVLECYEVVFVVPMPQIDAFLDDLVLMALQYR